MIPKTISPSCMNKDNTQTASQTNNLNLCSLENNNQWVNRGLEELCDLPKVTQ